jgi:hypothetical protein
MATTRESTMEYTCDTPIHCNSGSDVEGPDAQVSPLPIRAKDPEFGRIY